MATGTVLLTPQSAEPPDGSSGNAAPALTRTQGTEANPKKHVVTALFDPATDEHLWWAFRMPSNYSSGGTVKIQFMVNSTASANVVWGARLGAVTPTDADTPVEHAQATAVTATVAVNTTEARRLLEGSIDLTGNLDSAAAGDFISLVIYRDADNGSDTCSVDAEFLEAAFEYTTT